MGAGVGVGVGANMEEEVANVDTSTLVDLVSSILDDVGITIDTVGVNENITSLLVTTAIQSKLSPPKFMQASLFLQGFGKHGLVSISHTDPLKPAKQVQMNASTRLLQVALFKHGLDSHSLTSSEQFLPVKPETHLHVNVELPSMQDLVPVGLHGPNKVSEELVMQ